MYPRELQAQDGRLRLMYEANPMALIVEQRAARRPTGAPRSSTSSRKGCIQRVAVILGSRNEVDASLRTHRQK